MRRHVRQPRRSVRCTKPQNGSIRFSVGLGKHPFTFLWEPFQRQQDQCTALLGQECVGLNPVLGDGEATPLMGWGGSDQNSGVGFGILQPGGQPSRWQPGRKTIKRGTNTRRHRTLTTKKKPVRIYFVLWSSATGGRFRATYNVPRIRSVCRWKARLHPLRTYYSLEHRVYAHGPTRRESIIKTEFRLDSDTT
jgi:hypothetical protein